MCPTWINNQRVLGNTNTTKSMFFCGRVVSLAIRKKSQITVVQNLEGSVTLFQPPVFYIFSVYRAQLLEEHALNVSNISSN